MPFQSGRNVLVAFKAETTFNTPPSAGSGTRFRPNASTGLKLARATIAPNEIRADGMTSMARMGSRSVSGGYAADLSVGTFDALIEAAMRGTWLATFVVANGTLGSVTTTANTIVVAAGSWITDGGLKVGDVIRLAVTGGPAGNNNRNLRITALTGTTITVAETLTVDASARAVWVLTVYKRLIQGTTRRSFTFEEYDADIDLTEQCTGVRVSSMKITGQPDGMALIEFGLVGADMTPLTTGTSPFFTTPTLSTSIALTVADATIRYGGADVVLTAFEMTLDLRAGGQPVIGSAVTPDIFENPAQISGSISALRSDFTNITRALAETELELSLLLVEPESEPKDFIHFFLPRIKIAVPDKGFGGDGGMIETMSFMAGPKEGTTGYSTTMLQINTSAA